MHWAIRWPLILASELNFCSDFTALTIGAKAEIGCQRRPWVELVATSILFNTFNIHWISTKTEQNWNNFSINAFKQTYLYLKNIRISYVLSNKKRCAGEAMLEVSKSQKLNSRNSSVRPPFSQWTFITSTCTWQPCWYSDNKQYAS